MQILIDADACPRQIQKAIIHIAKKYNVSYLFISSYAHYSEWADQDEYLYVDSSFQAVDLVLASRVSSGDVVVTQDYGLASLVLAKGGKAISTRGMIYSEENIETLLAQRHLLAKLRKRGKRLGGPAKISQEDLNRFIKNFSLLIRSI